MNKPFKGILQISSQVVKDHYTLYYVRDTTRPLDNDLYMIKVWNNSKLASFYHINANNDRILQPSCYTDYYTLYDSLLLLVLDL